MQLEIKIGSKVTFDNDKYELFVSEIVRVILCEDETTVLNSV